MEICGLILLLMIFGPIVAKLLRGLAPVIAAVIGIALVLGVVALAFNVVSGVVGTAFELLFGPLGILLIMAGGGYLIYREMTKRRGSATFDAGEQGRITLPDEKVKRRSQPVIGDDGELVTLDELLGDEEPEKRKRR